MASLRPLGSDDPPGLANPGAQNFLDLAHSRVILGTRSARIIPERPRHDLHEVDRAGAAAGDVTLGNPLGPFARRWEQAPSRQQCADRSFVAGRLLTVLFAASTLLSKWRGGSR